MISHKIREIDPAVKNDFNNFINEAAELIKNGGMVIFPTQFLYGLGVDAYNIKAVDRVYNVKHRSYKKPILVLIKSKADIDPLVKKVPSAALILMEKYWPGNVTLVFEAKNNLPQNLTAGTGKIGIRIPSHPVAAALVHALDGPMTGTSANYSDRAGCSHISNLDLIITRRIDLILDAGTLGGGQGSTIVDITAGEPMILREGAISAKNIFNVLDKAAKTKN